MADPNIPPPPWKVTNFFNFSGGPSLGWSETWYVNKTTFNDMAIDWAIVIAARMAIVGVQSVLTYARASRLDVKGDGVQLNSANINGTYTPAIGDISHPGVALLTRWTTSGGHSVNHVLHSIPEECANFGNYQPTSGYALAMTAFQSAVSTHLVIPRKTTVAPFVVFEPVSTVGLRRMVVRKLGRPFGLSRGRAAIH